MTAADVIRVIEKSYEVEQDEHAWMTGVVAAVRPLLDRGLGFVATLYDASDVTRPRAGVVARFDVPETYDEDTLRAAFVSLSANCVRSLSVSTGCHLVRWEDRFRDDATATLTSLPLVPSPHKPTDVLVINAADPSGRGCFVSANLPRGASLSRQARALWARLSAHVCAGMRLRRRLAASGHDGAEAVVAEHGGIIHASGAATSARARAAITAAAQARVRARGPLRASAPDEAVRQWRGLVAGQWTLVDQREHVVAQRNAPLDGTAWIETLTERELQVTAYASLGHWNKLIAYELGISASTVRVHIANAARKARVRSRAALLARFEHDRVITSSRPALSST